MWLPYEMHGRIDMNVCSPDPSVLTVAMTGETAMTRVDGVEPSVAEIGGDECGACTGT